MIFVKTNKILIKNPSRKQSKYKIDNINGTMNMKDEIIYPTEQRIKCHNKTQRMMNHLDFPVWCPV